MDAKWPAEQTVALLGANNVVHESEGTATQRTVQQRDDKAINARNFYHFARVCRTNTQQKHFEMWYSAHQKVTYQDTEDRG